MATRKSQPIVQGFARHLGATLAVMGLALSAVFGVVGYIALLSQTERSVRNQAELCAACIRPGAGGQIFRSVERLQQRFDGLAAVATLDSSGAIDAVYPTDNPYHEAAAAVLNRNGEATATGVFPEDGTDRELWGMVVSLNGDDADTARRAVVLLADRSVGSTVRGATLVFGACAAGVCLLGLGSCTGWFSRRVVRPLTELGNYTGLTDPRNDRAVVLDSQGWQELHRVGESYRWLAEQVIKSDRQRRQAERMARYRLDETERGFDRKLRRAKDEATVDPLTGLRNRSLLDTQLDMVFAACRSADQDLSAVMLDVDNFKPLNDTFGHAAGDDLLRFLGDLLRGSLRPADHAVRVGGDEFLLILPETSAAEAAFVTDRLVRLFGQHAASAGGARPVSLSAGVASLKKHKPDSAWNLIELADKALYEAKRGGKNEVCIGVVA